MHSQNMNEHASSSGIGDIFKAQKSEMIAKDPNELHDNKGIQDIDEDATDLPTNLNFDLIEEQNEQSSNDFDLFLSQTSLDELNGNTQYVPIASDNRGQEHVEMIPNSAVTILECRTVALDAHYFSKCGGYKLQDVCDPIRQFPLHCLEGTGIVYENGKFHSKNCHENGYQIFDHMDCGTLVNDCCKRLRENKLFQTLIERSLEPDKAKSHSSNKYLSYNQLTQRAENLSKKIAEEKLKVLVLQKKGCQLNKTLDIHQRIMLQIQSNSIPQLHQIVSIALKQKRNVQYVLSKIVDAVDGIFKPNHSVADKDLAILILQYGGPALLDICHKAIGFPSSSSCYKFMKKIQIF